MMNRRHFLKLSFLSGLVLNRSLKTMFQSKTFNELTFTNESGEKFLVRGYQEENKQYLSLNHLADYLSERHFMNEQRKKLVFVKNNQRVTFTGNNSFLKIDENFYQLHFPPVMLNNDMWILVDEFLDVMNAHSSIHLYFDATQGSLSYESKGYTITGLEVDERQNGSLIRILATKPFSKKEIGVPVIRSGKLHLSIKNGQIDENYFNNVPKIGILRSVKGIQHVSKNATDEETYTAELVFSVLGKPKRDQVNVYYDEETHAIVLSVATKMTLSEKKTVEKENESKREIETIKKDIAIDTIVIDAGHGGKDPGAVGKISSKKYLYEKTVVLDVSLKMKRIIEKNSPGTKVVLTRNVDEYIDIYKRGRIANKNKGKLFISVHCNSNKSRKANGFEVYVLGMHKDEAARKVALQENDAIKYDNKEEQKRFKGLSLILATMQQNSYVRQSIHLAESINRRVGQTLKNNHIRSRGVKQAGFYVLFSPAMPSILVELAFISNKKEVNVLRSKSERTKLASSISKGVLEYKRDIERTV